MNGPKALDIARLFEGSADPEIIAKDQVPARLRELADRLKPRKKPRLVLEECIRFNPQPRMGSRR